MLCRALQLVDTIACVLALVHVLSALKKFFKIQSSTATAHQYPAPFFYMYTLSNIAYTVSAGLPLLLMILRPAAYHQHRYQLALASRLVRAANSTVVLMSTVATAAITRALAAKVLTQQHRPYFALLLNTLQPAVFFAQQAMFIIPWRWAVPLQLLNFCGNLAWSTRLPCAIALVSSISMLSETCPAASSNGTEVSGSCAAPLGAPTAPAQFFLQSEASNTCQLLHYLTSLFGGLIGDMRSFHNMPHSSSGSHNIHSSSSSGGNSTWVLAAADAPPICEGYLAVQVLQVLMSQFLFLILPLGVIYWWEFTWKCRFLESRNVQYVTAFEGLCTWLLSRPSGDSSSSITTVSSGRLFGTSSGVTLDASRQQRSFLNYLCMLVTVPVVGFYAAWSLACLIVWSIPRGLSCEAIL